jgi:hypothetical protein
VFQIFCCSNHKLKIVLVFQIGGWWWKGSPHCSSCLFGSQQRNCDVK